MNMKNASDYLWFTVDVTEQWKQSKDDQVHIEVQEFYKRRRLAFPEQLLLTEKQTMEYYDSRFLLSPYTVQKQQITFLLESHRIVSFKQTEGSQ